MKATSGKKHGSEPLVEAAKSIGSTLGAVVATVRNAGERALGKKTSSGSKKSTRRRSAPRKRATSRVPAARKSGARGKVRKSTK